MITDKIQQARREMFEAWANQHRMPIGRDGVVVDYSSRATDACWMAFNAALDCVVIELPSERKVRNGWQEAAGADMAFNDCLDLCIDAIESTNLGIKVK